MLNIPEVLPHNQGHAILRTPEIVPQNQGRHLILVTPEVLSHSQGPCENPVLISSKLSTKFQSKTVSPMRL